MGMDFKLSESVVCAGKTLQVSKTITGDTGAPIEKALAAAKAGVLTVRTNGTDGSLTMAAGHGITTGAILDIYWDGGSCRGAVVGTVAGNVVPFTGAVGTALPIATTVISAFVPVVVPFAMVGNNMQAIAVKGGGRCTFSFQSSGSSELLARIQNNNLWRWYTGCGDTNPLAGVTASKVLLSNGELVANTILVAAVEN